MLQRYDLLEEHHFNSIKVRLKPRRRIVVVRIAPEFQFHKGTIKTSEHLQGYVRHFLFQFHKGTIKTRHPTSSYTTMSDFNSIKVRLKQHVADEVSKEIVNFNSIKVRLKPCDATREGDIIPISIP